jgi:hypothetical protein
MLEDTARRRLMIYTFFSTPEASEKQSFTDVQEIQCIKYNKCCHADMI